MKAAESTRQGGWDGGPQETGAGGTWPGKTATEGSFIEVTWSHWHWRKNWMEDSLAERGDRQEASREVLQRRHSGGLSSGSDSAPQRTLVPEGTFTVSPTVHVPILQMRSQGPVKPDALRLQKHHLQEVFSSATMLAQAPVLLCLW